MLSQPLRANSRFEPGLDHFVGDALVAVQPQGEVAGLRAAEAAAGAIDQCIGANPQVLAIGVAEVGILLAEDRVDRFLMSRSGNSTPIDFASLERDKHRRGDEAD